MIEEIKENVWFEELPYMSKAFIHVRTRLSRNLELTREGTLLLGALGRIDGVIPPTSSVDFREYVFGMEKGALFSWDEIRPQVEAVAMQITEECRMIKIEDKALFFGDVGSDGPEVKGIKALPGVEDVDVDFNYVTVTKAKAALWRDIEPGIKKALEGK